MEILQKVDRGQLGKYLRQYRKEHGIKIASLVEEGLSQSTISNIERGVITVEIDRIKRLCEKLEVDVEKMVERIKNIDSQRELIVEKLRSIESIITHTKDGTKTGLEMLDEIDLPKNDPLTAHVYYLKGKCFTRKQSWHKAKAAFQQSIEIVRMNPSLNKSNLKAAAFYDLARVYYYTHEYEQSFVSINQGIESFEDDGERQHIKYSLHILKVFCLEETGKVGEALKALTDMWGFIQEIDDMRLIVNMYDKRASLLVKMDLLEDAVFYLLEGIEKSRRNELADRSFDLWTALGKVYCLLGDFEKAKLAVDTALKMACCINNQRLLADAYTTLGKIYKETNQPKEAIKSLKQAIEHGKKNDPKLVDAFILLGDCYLTIGKIGTAINQYNQALETTSNSEKKLEATWKICECLEQKQEDEESKKALFNRYKNLVKLLKEIKGGNAL